MSQKYLIPVPNTLDKDRAAALLRHIRRRVSEGKITSYADLLREALATIDTFYKNLSEPITQPRVLDIDDARDPENVNLTYTEIEEDLTTSFNTARELSNAMASSFNYTSTLVAKLEGKVRKLTAQSQDLQHSTGVFTEDIITVGDSFTDNSKIDSDFSVSVDQAEILIGSGCILPREEAVSIVDDAEIVIESNYPIYEGKFYALDGESIPEGKSFHFKERPGTEPVGSFNVTDTPSAAAFKDPIPMVNTAPLKPATTDAGASIKEKDDNRNVMLDGNPDTFWQAEYAFMLPAFPDTEVTYQELVDYLSSPGIDGMDLDVTVTYKLPNSRILNFIVLDPANVGDGAWMEVIDISTSMDKTSWTPIEGLHDHNYENILTDEANEELTSSEVAFTLAPNKYQYAGKGVWTFPSVEARYIRVTIRQSVPVPAPYDIQAVELQQSVTDTVTREKNKSFIGDIFGG